jgi:hypothetical protein
VLFNSSGYGPLRTFRPGCAVSASGAEPDSDSALVRFGSAGERSKRPQPALLKVTQFQSLTRSVVNRRSAEVGERRAQRANFGSSRRYGGPEVRPRRPGIIRLLCAYVGAQRKLGAIWLAEGVRLASNVLGSSGWGTQGPSSLALAIVPAGRIHSWLRGRRSGRRNKGSEVGPVHQS